MPVDVQSEIGSVNPLWSSVQACETGDSLCIFTQRSGQVKCVRYDGRADRVHNG